ncbi:uncharacterized protein IWZ02DRAFT_489362 [Phyllosticta citriasiana]|uniref:uncharacterized protein n=1 Tax=Phyllosticta citriasiana TaxID=595635 RepID=UPI0030FD8255
MASRAAPNTTRTRTAAGVPNEPSETYEERQRRYNAARVLESNEMLIWWSTVRNESIPQTRLHFENILAGFASDDSEPEWDDEPSGGPPPAGTPGVHVRFLFGENDKRGQADASSSAVVDPQPPDMVLLGGERVERRRPGIGTTEALEAARADANALGGGSGRSRGDRRSRLLTAEYGKESVEDTLCRSHERGPEACQLGR